MSPAASASTPRATITDPVLIDFATEVGDSGPVTVRGAGTRWQVGGPVAESARVIAAPTGVVDHIPSEMIVTVRAGTPVTELHRVLAEAGQRTGLPERGGTVGGAVAVGENSLHVQGRGRVRDAVLQVRYVSDQGRLVTGGGPTVKNVTGFDLPRLMVGSLGTLGLFADFVLRTNPIPEVTTWVSSTELDPFAVAGLVLAPSTVLWDGTTTWVELEGHEAVVAADRQRLGAAATVVEADGPPERPPHRWSLRPADLRPADPSGGGLPAGTGATRWVASIGVGTVWADAAQPQRAPSPGVAALAERVKTQFDPGGRLNPGRTPGS